MKHLLCTELSAQISREITKQLSSQKLLAKTPTTAPITSKPQQTFAQVVKKPTISRILRSSPITPSPTTTTPVSGSLRSGKTRLPSTPLTNTKPSKHPTTTVVNKQVSQPLTKSPRPKSSTLLKIDKTVIIKPKIAQDADTTRTEIQKSLNPVDLEVIDVRSLSSGSLAIRCATVSSAQKLQHTVESSLSEKFDAEMQTPLKPRLKISGFSNEFSDNQLISTIVQQNNLPSTASLKVIRMKELKSSPETHAFAILEADVNTFNLLSRMKNLNIGWNRCTVHEHVDVRRCYRCSEYGHYATNCTKPQSCPICAEAHLLTECNATIEKCANCVAFNRVQNRPEQLALETSHSARSTNCPIYQKRLKAAKARTDYTA
ncbi:uncharacterized protein LOC129752919 [Uranotaenia lowii]|uniref:uncharacterized protein LOC129752919 n=1 Tax=Uranotaenia lowii TaxID=190385 RepID=UPI002479BFBF|nr:uncharacterized protein LOC129752919 [Uranotaenia lowii]